MISMRMEVMFLIVFFGLGFCISPESASALSVSGSVNPSKIFPGQSVTLTWNISGATSCTVDSSLYPKSSLPPTNGSQTWKPDKAETFVLECTDGIETKRAVDGFTIVSEIKSFTASSQTVALGDPVVLSWTTEYAADCYIGVGTTTVGGKHPPNGSYTVYPATSPQTRYSLSCSDPPDVLSGNKSVSINVSGVSTTAPTATISVNGVSGQGPEKKPSSYG